MRGQNGSNNPSTNVQGGGGGGGYRGGNSVVIQTNANLRTHGGSNFIAAGVTSPVSLGNDNNPPPNQGDAQYVSGIAVGNSNRLARSGNGMLIIQYNLPVAADMAITKTNNLSGTTDQTNDTLSRGQTTTYRIVVTNNGPSAVTGAVVTDTATGLTCNSLTCTSNPAGLCPSPAPTVAQLLGSGITLPTMAASNSVTLDVDCTVN